MSLVSDDLDILAELRALTPRSPATWSDAYSVAERQAIRLLRIHHVAEPPVPQFLISSLPGITVDRRHNWPTSGMAVSVKHGWRIVIRADEPIQRQRFSLAHEFKHILDDPFIDRLYRRLPEHRRAKSAERLCNVFAACLLMPRAWVKRDWCAGEQRVGVLARRYCVSTKAMTNRLNELGLTDSQTVPTFRDHAVFLHGARL
jgi:predicted transcriptional regulator